MKPGVIFHLGPTHMLDEQQTVCCYFSLSLPGTCCLYTPTSHLVPFDHNHSRQSAKSTTRYQTQAPHTCRLSGTSLPAGQLPPSPHCTGYLALVLGPGILYFLSPSLSLSVCIVARLLLLSRSFTLKTSEAPAALQRLNKPTASGSAHGNAT